MNALEKKKLKKQSYLIVDDNELDRELIIREVKKGFGQGTTCLESGNIEDGIKTLKSGRHFDCIILDNNLPDGDSISFIKKLKEEKLDYPLVVTTGHGSELLVAKLMQAGALDYINKNNINLNSISRAVGNAIRIHDINLEKKKLHSELACEKDKALESSRLKSQFLSSMSHEIRTPLNAIQGAIEILSESKLDREQIQYISVLEHASETLLALINDILDLSKVEAGELKLEYVSFDLKRLMEDVMSMMKVQAKEKKLKLSYHINENVMKNFIGDPIRLQQVLINLISNSIKFTEIGHVLINIEKEVDENILISVEDTGIGIAPKNLEKIFDSFVQADASTTRRYGGTGLGLTICKRLIEMMGGEISVHSELNKGTTFSFRLTPISAIGEENNFCNGYALSLKDFKFLIIDKDKINRERISNMITSHDGPAFQLENISEAVKWLKDNSLVDIIFIDEAEFKEENYKKIDELKQLFPNNRCVLMLSSEREMSELSEFTKMDFLLQIVKPIKERHLKSLINSILGLKENYTKRQEDRGHIPAVDYRNLDLLLVDDSDDNRFIIKAFLQETSYNIDIAINGEEAVEKFKNKEYDLILMDMQMPVMDGYKATQNLRIWESRHRNYRTPILAFTASVLKEEIRKAVISGCDDYLTKPTKKNELKLKILEHTNYFQEKKMSS